MRLKAEIREALDELAASDAEGYLYPDVVVERARDKKSALHGCFTWEDKRAAHAFRLNEARELIRTYHVVIQQEPPLMTRAYVSLRSSRAQGGGYLPIHRVLSHKELHDEMLRDAWEDLENVRQRYGHLRELQPVFAAMRRVRMPRPASGVGTQPPALE